MSQRESVLMAELTIDKTSGLDEEVYGIICANVIGALMYFGDESVAIDQIHLHPRIVEEECVLALTITYKVSGVTKRNEFNLTGNWNAFSIASAINKHTGIPFKSDEVTADKLVSVLESIPISPISPIK